MMLSIPLHLGARTLLILLGQQENNGIDATKSPAGHFSHSAVCLHISIRDSTHLVNDM